MKLNITEPELELIEVVPETKEYDPNLIHSIFQSLNDKCDRIISRLQYLKSIKRYTYRSTTAAISLLQENTLVKRDKNIDDEGIKKFKKELSQQMKREKEALIILADEIRKKTYQTPTDLFFDQSVRDELLFPRITDSK